MNLYAPHIPKTTWHMIPLKKHLSQISFFFSSSSLSLSSSPFIIPPPELIRREHDWEIGHEAKTKIWVGGGLNLFQA